MKRTLCVLFISCLITVSFSAHAQDEPPQDSSFAFNIFEPVPGPKNYITIDGPDVGYELQPTAGFLFNYQRKPFVIYAADENNEVTDEAAEIVGNLMIIDFMASFSFLERFMVGLGFPLLLWQSGHEYEVIANSVLTEGDPVSISGKPGDIRIHLKAHIIKLGPVGLAVAAIPTIPISYLSGVDNDFGGDGNVTGRIKAIVGVDLGDLNMAFNIGAHIREESTFFSTEVGSQLIFGGALKYDIIPEIDVYLEAIGANGFTTQIDETPFEAYAGGIFSIARDFHIKVGAGPGILGGVGVPQFIAFAGFQWAEAKDESEVKWDENDRDLDGIPNDEDQCPDEAEDFDQYQDEDGCPDKDNDGDGILDGYDSCPMEKEDKDGYRDDDGCPDLDDDEDGIPIPQDQCPDEPEDTDGFEDEDGCPDPDNDGDGVPDEEDQCFDEAEDKDGFEDDDGCPDPDNDRDGVPDSEDRCPDKPETLNGFKDDDGCPDRGKQLVVITENQIEIKQQINFGSGSDKIKGSKSFQILDIVAKILVANPQIRVSIDGHTDNRGSAKYNRELSKKRADAVKEYLVDKGVGADRMETQGYGPDKPIESNRTRKGRDANRRVEFNIIKPETAAAPAPADTADDGVDMQFDEPAEGGEETPDMSFSEDET